jgi:hypothetical protein
MTSPLDIRGHTVRRDGEIVATLTYAGDCINVRNPAGQVIGRLVEYGGGQFGAWTAVHPAVPTPSDRQLVTLVAEDIAIQSILDHDGEASTDAS